MLKEKRKLNYITGIIFPLVAAFIWGSAFVAQSVSADLVPPFTFTASRSAIAFISLLIVILLLKKSKKISTFLESGAKEKGSRKDLLVGGICCGTMLSIATNLQQAGLLETSPGKAGFITALYIVLVPILGLLLKKRVAPIFWVSVVIATIGLYLLCITEALTISKSDLLVLLCAFCFAVHILFIDHFTQKVDGVKLSCIQFLTVAVTSSVLMLIFETPSLANLLKCIWPIIYVGVFSSAIAYTLQIIAQKGNNPTVVSLLLSLESVFAVITGALILGQGVTFREGIGCMLMFGAVILAQLPQPHKK